MRRFAPVLLLLASFPASASPGDLAACLAVADPAQRLACYDQAAGRPADVVPRRDPVVDFGRPAAAAPRDPAVDFGKPPALPPDTKELREISSTVTGSTTDGNGRLVLILANDQAWSVQGFDRPLPPREETPVTISRGFLLGNYLMSLPSGAYGASRIR